MLKEIFHLLKTYIISYQTFSKTFIKYFNFLLTFIFFLFVFFSCGNVFYSVFII